MMITKTIVILAKSIKHGKYCIAGKDINSKIWIRPVSDVNGAELSEQQCKCTNDDWHRQGKSPYNSNIFKKIEINFLLHTPLIHQPENHLISNIIWKHKYNINEYEIHNYLDKPDSLWGNNDSIDYSLISSHNIVITQSLYLVKVDNLTIYMNNNNKRRASFSYKSISYDLPVTDPNFDNLLQNSNFSLSGILCVSLGENYQGYCYKIIATLFIVNT